MADADLQALAFTDEAIARAAMEAVLWPNGPVCPRCGTQDKIGAVSGKSARPGLYYCGHCKRQFTVTVGTIFERSKIPLSKWWLAVDLLGSSKKGMSSHQLHRALGVTYQTAWFMSHRIREAMRDGALSPLGGTGKTVEADETFIGRKKGSDTPRGGYSHKHIVFALVERGGQARTIHISELTKIETNRLLRENVKRESRLMTDEALHYRAIGKEFAGHGTIHHALGEYVSKDDRTIHTNAVEGYFSVFKRGMKGVYQHCGEKHLHRYLAEFDFRYNNRVALGVDDNARTARIMRGAGGKRLMYRRPDEDYPA